MARYAVSERFGRLPILSGSDPGRVKSRDWLAGKLTFPDVSSGSGPSKRDYFARAAGTSAIDPASDLRPAAAKLGTLNLSGQRAVHSRKTAPVRSQEKLAPHFCALSRREN